MKRAGITAETRSCANPYYSYVPNRHHRMENQHKTSTFLALTPPGGVLKSCLHDSREGRA